MLLGGCALLFCPYEAVAFHVAHYTDRQAYTATREYAVHLQKAEGLVCRAEDLVGLMRAAISYESDARAMQADAALSVIGKKLAKAHSCINRHDRRHTNLFLAYFDLKDKSDESAE